MVNGFRPTLDICLKCEFLHTRESKRLKDTRFHYCRAGEGAQKLPEKQKTKIASIKAGKITLNHVPTTCVYYLEHLINTQRDSRQNG